MDRSEDLGKRKSLNVSAVQCVAKLVALSNNTIHFSIDSFYFDWFSIKTESV